MTGAVDSIYGASTHDFDASRLVQLREPSTNPAPEERRKRTRSGLDHRHRAIQLPGGRAHLLSNESGADHDKSWPIGQHIAQGPAVGERSEKGHILVADEQRQGAWSAPGCDE